MLPACLPAGRPLKPNGLKWVGFRSCLAGDLVLDKVNFVNAEDAGGEWHSEYNQKPIFVCRVSKKLADDIFTFDTVATYPAEEMSQINEFISTKKTDAS